jgi:hypothetical protein
MLAGGSTAGPLQPRGSLSLVDFDRSEWEIMYPCFIESELVALPERTDD